MNISLSRIFSAVATLSISAFVLCSCVNEKYSTDEIDGTAVILKDLALPIGSLEKISVGEIIQLDENDQMITKDANGDYAFNFSGGNPFYVTFKVPSFSIPFVDGAKADDHYISINTGLGGVSAPSIDKKIALENQRIEKFISVQDSYKLPYQITDLKSIETALVINYKFSTNAGAFYLASGFSIDFPDWLVVEKYDERTDYVVETQGNNKNVVRFIRDFKIGFANPEVLGLRITMINLPDGMVVDGGVDSEGRPCKKISINDLDPENKIVVTGDVYIQTKDFSVIPDKAELKMHMEFSNFEIKSAEAKINMSKTVEDKEIPIVDYPDFFTQEGIVIDLYNPELHFDFNNSLDIDFDFNADIKAFKNSVEKVSSHIGDAKTPGTESFIIPASKSSHVVLSRNGNGDGVLKLEALGDIYKALPDKIIISNMTLNSMDGAPDEYSHLIPGHQFSCSVAYELRAAFAFGPEFRLPYTMEINNLGDTFKDLGLKSTNLILTVENSIPLNFSISAKGLDENGNPKEDMSIQVAGEVKSGTPDSPSVNTIEITINTTSDVLSLNSLKMNLTATCPSVQHQGIALNEAQALHIKTLALSLPDGITLDLNN